ncbi:MAG: phenylalanine--tRNA ligase subunit alpha [Patescibacteria group bacterium]|jgi:phenylalanyl-tRNA synthetase alpha chain
MSIDFIKFESEALAAIKAVGDATALEAVENKLLGRKQGEFTSLMKGMAALPPEERKLAGTKLNELKNKILASLEEKKQEINNKSWNEIGETEKIDLTAPPLPTKKFGHFHPNTIIQKDLEDLFSSMGFIVLDGPELESDYYNFSALNIPETHPARDMQDTFYIKDHSGSEVADKWVMRTHTSPMQVRAMQKFGVPLRAIVPGKCYRNESTDVRHEHTFYQLEGFIIDKGINLSHMKGVLETVAKHLYGDDTALRMRPKYYPFVEPGVNYEVTCFLCKGKGCRVCKSSGWLEIGGAGMIHRNVLKEGGIDHKVYSGFAFGFGLTRLVMLRYGIDDIRLLESGNLKFLEQF